MTSHSTVHVRQNCQHPVRFWKEIPRSEVVGRFHIVLFTALEQAHYALVLCDSESVAVAFYSFFKILFFYDELMPNVLRCQLTY